MSRLNLILSLFTCLFLLTVPLLALTKEEEKKKAELEVLSNLLNFKFDKSCTEKRENYFYRSINGECNWLKEGEAKWGSTGMGFSRDFNQVSFTDGFAKPREGPNPRELSNIFFKRKEKFYYEHTPVLLALVEFVIHDISSSMRNKDKIVVDVPKCDPHFDVQCHGNKTLTMWGTAYVEGTGTGPGNPKQTLNNGSSWLDLSPLYGNVKEISDKLRSFENGKLLAQIGKDGREYLPWNTIGLPMNGYGDRSKLFAGGDVRTNQDWMLIAVHTLFFRNHNRLCDILVAKYPTWDDEKLFQYARHLNIAGYNVALNEYQMAYFTDEMSPPADDGFPLWRQFHGKTSSEINPYHAYPWELAMVDGKPMILSEETAIGYRFHDLIPEDYVLYDENGRETKTGKVAETSFDAIGFFEAGIEDILRGMVNSTIPNFHSGVSEDLRSGFVSYAVPQEGFGYDIAAWTIVHERERGLPTFNEYFRKYPGKIPVKIRETFEEFTSDPELVKELKRLYKTPDEVDFMVGLQLDEDYFPGTTVPNTMLITSLFSLFGLAASDRFSIAYTGSLCFLVGKPWDCTPLNPVDELFWAPLAELYPSLSFITKIFPRARWVDEFWLNEFNMMTAGRYSVWNLVTKNTGIKCLQMHALFPADPVTNPVVCSLPPLPPSNIMRNVGLAIALGILIIYGIRRCMRKKPSGEKKTKKVD